MAISTNGAIITRVTSALYGEYLSNASYTEVSTTAPATLAASFLSNDFAGKTDLQIATTMLTNLGLTSITGLDNWLSAQLTAAGSTTAAKGAKIVSILNDYANLTADATYGTYATSFNAKVAAGLVKSQTTGSAGGSFSTADAVAITNGTFDLTTGLDTGTAFTGGSGNDTFNAIDTVAGTGTLTNGDSVVGGAGTDTLYVVATSTAVQPSFSGSGVEVLSVVNNKGGSYEVGTSLMSGLTNVKTTAGTGATSITGATAILSSEMVSTNFGLTVAGTSTLVSGEADSASLTLNGVGTTTDTAFTYDGIETLNVALSTNTSGSSTAATSVTLTSADLEKVVVTGSAAARLITTLSGATSATQTGVFDASAATGAITATVTAGSSGNSSIVGGSANDTITLGEGTITKAMTVDGGAGTDTLKLTSATYSSTATTQAGANVTNFEKINAGGGTVELTAFTKNTFTETTGTGTYNEVNAGVTKSTLASGSLTLDRATDTTADALTVDLTGATAQIHAAVTLLDEETITINSAGTGSSGLNHTITALTLADATSLTVTGSRGLIVTTLSGSENLKTIDASANTGPAVTISAADSNVAMTITGGAGVGLLTTSTVNSLTGGSGKDSITGGAYIDSLDGGLGNDTISGGAGNDSLTGGGGADSLLGGDGDDSISAGSGDDYVDGGAGNDSINAGAGTDTIEGGAGNDRIVVTLTDSTVVTDSAGTADRVANTTGTITTTTIAGVAASLVAVTDDVAPTLTGIESLYVSVNADASTAATDYVILDLTKAANLTTLFTSTYDAEPTKYTNFSGSTINLYGDLTSSFESTDLVIDGVSQAALTVNLKNWSGASTDALAFTGVTALTLSGNSTSYITGSADTSIVTGAVSAVASDSVTVSTTGSAGAGTLTIASLTATAASTIKLTAGAGDDLIVSGTVAASGAAVETLTLTVGDASGLGVARLNLGASTVDAATITIADAGVLSTDSTTTGGGIDFDIGTATTMTYSGGAGSTGKLDLTGEVVTAGAFAVGTAATLNLGGLGVVSTLGSGTSSFVFTGRGDVDNGAGSNVFSLAGTSTTFNTSGLTVDADAMTVYSAATKSTIRTGLGQDTIWGGTGNDVINGGAGTDTITGDSTGVAEVQTVTITWATASATDVLTVLGTNVSFVTGTTATTAATAAAAAINSTLALSGLVTATSSAGVVTLTFSAALGDVAESVDTTSTNNTNAVATSTAGSLAAAAGGTDALTGGLGLDTFVFAAGSSVATIGGTLNAGTITLFDTITDFTLGTASANSETLNVQGTGAVSTNATAGTASTLTVDSATIKSHAITNGVVTFDDVTTFATAITIDSLAEVAAAVQYLTTLDLGGAGDSLMFTDGTNSYVYTQASTAAGGDVVQLVGVLGLSLSATNANTAGLVFIS